MIARGGISKSDAKPWRARMRGLVRLSTYAGLIGLVGLAATARYARAGIGEAAVGLGRDLEPLRDLLVDANIVRMNGQTIHVAAVPSSDSMDVVLDRVRSYCDAHPGQIAAYFPGAAPTSKPSTPFLFHGDDDGAVLCIASTDAEAHGFLPALRAFLHTHDMGAFGMMRYAHVQKAPVGSQVMTIWTDEHFSMDALAAREDSDTPGSDPAIAGRPLHSRRVVSAVIEGTTYGVYHYRTPDPVADVWKHFDAVFSSWKSTETKTSGRPARVYSEDGKRFVVIEAVREEANLRTLVSITEAGNQTKAGGAR